MDKDTLLYLLKDGHMNMSVRIEKGIWPHPPIYLKECIDAIIFVLEQDKYFPYPWIDRHNGEPIDDVAVIEKNDEGEFIFRYREASPANLKIIGINEIKTFRTADSAAEYYLHKILHLPGDLDGWQVIE